MIKIVTACAILHNMSVAWADEQPELDHPALGPEQLPRMANPNIRVPAIPVPGTTTQLRNEAQRCRDNYRAVIDPVPTQRERERMNRHRIDIATL